jgi:hypothetical protein
MKTTDLKNDSAKVKIKATLSKTIDTTIPEIEKKADTNRFFTFDLCEAEYNKCLRKCQVQLIKGEKLEIGCYIKVFFDKDLFIEGYIMEHISGQIFILESKNDASNPAICGGCCGDAYSIDIAGREIWGC